MLMPGLYSIETIKIRYKTDENLAGTLHKTKTFFGHCETPCRIAIQKLMEKFGF